MRLTEESDGDVTIVGFLGELDGSTLPQANDKLDSLIRALRIRLVFDLDGLEVITSTAISFFLDATRRLRTLNGEVVLSRPTRLFKRTTEALKIDSQFKVFDDNEQALAHFRERDREASGPGREARTSRPRWMFWKR